jgi:nickel-dependent lactate racemase
MKDDLPILSPVLPCVPDADLSAAVRSALAHLDAAGAKSLTIAVNDPQRQTDTRPILEILAKKTDLARARVLVAAGTHSFRVEEQREFRRKLCEGLPVAGFAWHDCHSGELVPIGKDGLWRGHPWLLEADAVLAVGSVEPHYFAGFTGAHKTATIGCAAYADIEANHAWATHPSCRPCQLEGNPIFLRAQGLLEALEGERPVAAVNLIQAGGRLIHAGGGSAMDTLFAALPRATETFCRKIPQPADALVAEVEGPLGVSFYQADKGIKNNEWAVRQGGCLILSAPCPRGIGQDHFMALLRQADRYDQAVEVVNRRGYRLGDHKAVRLRYLTDAAHRAVRLFIVSDGISAEDAAVLGAAKAPTVAAALELAGIRPGRDSVYRVQDAGNVCVLVEGSSL